MAKVTWGRPDGGSRVWVRDAVLGPAGAPRRLASVRDLVYDCGKRGKEGKSLQIIRSHGGVPIRLTDERWKHISENHPEMGLMRQEVLETIAEPDLIQQGDSGELLAVRRYESTPMTSKYLVVPYREVSREDGFVLTAYLTNRPSSLRSVVWKR